MPTIETKDLSMFYKIIGTGEPVLLIHGLGGDHRGWEFQDEAMAQHFTVIIPDMRGHGRTQAGELGMMINPDDFADDLDLLISNLDYEAVHVVGHSMGGIIAQHFVLRYPNRVNKLVLIGTSPRVHDTTIDVVYSWREAQVEGGQEAYFWASLRSGYNDEWIDSNPDLVQHFKEKAADVNEAGVVAAGLGLATLDMTENLASIKAETMILHGENDRVIPVEMGHLINSKIKGSCLRIFEDCGHSPTVEYQDEVNQILIAFFKK
ncbi:MAG: alpha/beta fold hydrolase [Candidatus Hodarchaeota archaeon]